MGVQVTFLLRFNSPDETDGLGKWHAPVKFPRFLVRLGGQWPHDPRYRLIQATSADRAEARQFASEEDALAAWSEAGSPRGWDVVPL